MFWEFEVKGRGSGLRFRAADGTTAFKLQQASGLGFRV